MTAIYVIMGVSGSGKSTIGQALAAKMGCQFYDGDDFHSPENIAKMESGLPLTDADRWPWLDQLAQLIGDQIRQEEPAVLACSVLKRSYRDRLRQDSEGLVFIYLRGSFDVIWDRIQDRKDHYMKADMLRSQFDALEEPDEQEALLVDIDDDADNIISKLIVSLDIDSS